MSIKTSSDDLVMFWVEKRADDVWPDFLKNPYGLRSFVEEDVLLDLMSKPDGLRSFVKEKADSELNGIGGLVKNERDDIYGSIQSNKVLSDKESALPMVKKLVTDERSKAWAAGDKNLSSEIASHYTKALGSLGLGGLLGALGLQSSSKTPELSKTQKMMGLAKKNKAMLAALGLGGLGVGGLAASAFGSRE